MNREAQTKRCIEAFKSYFSSIRQFFVLEIYS